jgi:hypothetical protein
MEKTTAPGAKRNLLKKAIPNDVPEVQWNCGEDVPISWEPEDLRKMSFKTIKNNLKIGAIDKQTYKALMEGARNRAF